MNKKLILLLIPLMLLPIAATGFAHWTDTAKKNYYMRAGTVKTEIIWWHIEGTNTYDVDCDGVIYGDEIQILPITEWDEELEEDEVVKLDIIVDPIYPSWFLDLEIIIHNKGRLIIKAEAPIIEWTINGQPGIPGDPIGPGHEYWDDAKGMPVFFEYIWKYYIWNSEYTQWVEVEPTTMVIKPCEVLRVKQYIHFIGQDYPELQCHWLDLHVEIPFIQWIGETWDSKPDGPYVPPVG